MNNPNQIEIVYANQVGAVVRFGLKTIKGSVTNVRRNPRYVARLTYPIVANISCVPSMNSMNFEVPPAK